MKTQSVKTLLIIPAYNEEEAILKTVAEVQHAGYDYLIVNDGSRDNTLSVCKQNNLSVCDLKVNLGIGGAVQAGYKYAQRAHYDVAVQFDGDGQHDIACVPALLAAITQGKDLVIGSRFAAHETGGFRSSLMRRVGIYFLRFLIGKQYGVSITDPTSGFRAANKRTIALFAHSYPSDYPEPESIVMARKAHLVVDEVPVVMRKRQGGNSSIKAFSSMYYMVKVSLAILILKLFRR